MGGKQALLTPKKGGGRGVKSYGGKIKPVQFVRNTLQSFGCLQELVLDFAWTIRLKFSFRLASGKVLLKISTHIHPSRVKYDKCPLGTYILLCTGPMDLYTKGMHGAYKGHAGGMQGACRGHEGGIHGACRRRRGRRFIMERVSKLLCL